MLLSVKLMKSAFHVCGLYPFAEAGGNLAYKMHGHAMTVLLAILILGLAVQTFFSAGSYKLLPFTYALCTAHGLHKRITLFYHKDKIKTFLTAIDHSYEYTDQWDMKEMKLSNKTLLRIYRIVTLLLLQLFFCAYASPFSRLMMGDTLDYSENMYPMYVPWKVKSFPMYLITYFIQAILVSPALMGIYATTVYIVFSMIQFKYEFDKLSEAIRTLECRSLKHFSRNNFSANAAPMARIVNSKNPKLIEAYDRIYISHLRECILHYQHFLKTFKAFSRWYNSFFTAELIESTSTICLLFFCFLTMNDRSIFFNIISLSFHVVTSLFFRCYTGEFLLDMNKNLRETLYDITWYHQPAAVMKMLKMFQTHIEKPLTLHGLNHFPSSYRTFAGVSRISYSYCNFLIASLK